RMVYRPPQVKPNAGKPHSTAISSLRHPPVRHQRAARARTGGADLRRASVSQPSALAGPSRRRNRRPASGGIVDIDELVAQTEPLGQMLTQGLHAETLGRVVAGREVMQPALPRDVRGRLGDLATEEGIHAGGCRLLNEALTGAAAPGDGADLC